MLYMSTQNVKQKLAAVYDATNTAYRGIAEEFLSPQEAADTVAQAHTTFLRTVYGQVDETHVEGVRSTIRTTAQAYRQGKHKIAVCRQFTAALKGTLETIAMPVAAEFATQEHIPPSPEQILEHILESV